MLPNQFAKVYDHLNGEQQKKIEGIISEYGLSHIFENDFTEAFAALPKNIQERITSIIIPDEINFNRFGMEQTTKKFDSDCKEYDLLNDMEDEYWEVYYEIMCSQNVSISYNNAEDEFAVEC